MSRVWINRSLFVTDWKHRLVNTKKVNRRTRLHQAFCLRRLASRWVRLIRFRRPGGAIKSIDHAVENANEILERSDSALV